MDVRVVNDVHSTWEIVESMAPEAAALFNKNLFEADPAMQHLCKGNMEEQGNKLMQMIQTVGGALMKKLEQGLGPSFTPQVRDSWSEVYGVMSSVMVAAAEA